jgi:hypothetical protein
METVIRTQAELDKAFAPCPADLTRQFNHWKNIQAEALLNMLAQFGKL